MWLEYGSSLFNQFAKMDVFEEESYVSLITNKITRSVGRAFAFVDAHQRWFDIKRTYTIDDFIIKFMNDTTTLVGAKNGGEIGKKIDNLMFHE